MKNISKHGIIKKEKDGKHFAFEYTVSEKCTIKCKVIVNELPKSDYDTFVFSNRIDCDCKVGTEDYYKHDNMKEARKFIYKIKQNNNIIRTENSRTLKIMTELI